MPTPTDMGAATPLLARLVKQLRDAHADLVLADRYYSGEHPLPFLSRKAASRYRELLRMSRTNWPALVVDTVTDRLRVEGYRVDARVDDQLWQVWQANGMDMDASLLHTDAVLYGTGYTMVWPDDSVPGGVRITSESPYEVAHVWATGRSPRRVGAALKVWPDWEAGQWQAWLFTPTATEQWAADLRTQNDKTPPAAKHWQRAGAATANPFVDMDHVGVVAHCIRMRTDGTARSELDGLLSQVDRINTMVVQRVLAGEYAAFRQRWATGLDIPVDDNGDPVEPFNVAVDRLIVSEDSDTSFGSFDVTDLRPYIDAVAQDVQHLASVSRTPPHYLLGEMVNISAEALKAAEAGLVSKVRNRMLTLGEAWETTMRLAMALQGVVDPVLDRCEVVWGDPEHTSEATRMDALTKMQALGVPTEVLWERMPGVTQSEVARWRTMRGADTVQQMLRTGRVPDGAVAEGAAGTVVPAQQPAG